MSEAFQGIRVGSGIFQPAAGLKGDSGDVWEVSWFLKAFQEISEGFRWSLRRISIIQERLKDFNRIFRDLLEGSGGFMRVSKDFKGASEVKDDSTGFRSCHGRLRG